MNRPIATYNTIVFDCDGVVLDSNKVKSLAFYEAAKEYGDDSAQALVHYHMQNGGISRYIKFEHFLTKILKRSLEQAELDDLLTRYAAAVKQGLMNCQVVEGLHELREFTSAANWLIVSGGDQAELREVFSARGLDIYFDGGIFGSPDNKDLILEREKANENIGDQALFLGDSKYDYKAATKAGLDFVFISQWTEVQDWESFCSTESIENQSAPSSFLE